MIYLLMACVTMLSNEEITLFDFNQDADLSNWYVVDDGVMGGLSQGQMSLSEDGHGVFEGFVSLENNGGFTSIRLTSVKSNLTDQKSAFLKVRGDGKTYQFRVKSKHDDRHAYIYNFVTSGDWEVIEIPLEDMIPSFRGMKLNMPNYEAKKIDEVGILIGNKTPESFKLEIDLIYLK